MEEKSSFLVLRLEGALQSWGESAKWDTRDSASMPSKSGIVGLIACAMGLTRDDPTIAELGEAIQIAVRADRPGIKTVDFQTVTGDPLRTAEGKPRGGNTIISQRTYLQDASFLAVIQTEPEWRERIVQALQHPKWALYLGRKSCVPSRPILECVDAVGDDLLDVVRSYPAADRAVFPMIYETEIPVDYAASYTRSDVRKTGNRNFERRKVWRGVIKEAADVSDKD